MLFFSRILALIVRQAMDSRAAVLESFVVMIASELVFGILGSLITAWSRAIASSAPAPGERGEWRAAKECSRR